MARKMKTMDGNTAAAYTSYNFTEVAAIYPITPSSDMAEITDEWAANGKKNIFGQTVKVVEMQSEAGAAGAVHGSLQAGALTTTYTASQGLLLMIPNMYKMAGELLPGVIHVSARAIATHALSIFGDHSDVMSCRQTGYAILGSSGVQEVMDLGAVAHLSAIKGRVPFLHFFDGFRTSHEIQKIEVLEAEEVENLIDKKALMDFRKRALNPEHPVLRGSAQNSDIYFQFRESANTYYQNLPSIVENYMNEINKITGRNYKLFNYYGDPDAEKVIIAMGSVCDTVEEVVDYLRAKGEKVGMVKVHLFRPFATEKFLEAVPKTVKKIAVLDRTKEPGSPGEPLYLDIASAFYGSEAKPVVVGGRYGLASKDTTPSQILSVFENLKNDEPKTNFTIGIEDDVTFLSLPINEEISVTPEGETSCKFWGLGSDGTVGANKNSIKIIGDNTDMFAQAYFAYDSKKSGGVTQSHLRFGKKPIRAPYLVKKADFVACHNPSYVNKYDMCSDLKDGGIFLLNTDWTVEDMEKTLPANMKREIANKNIQFYTVDATHIAKEIGLGNRTNSVLQSAFFKLTSIIPIEDAVKYMKEAIFRTYNKKGDKVINMNYEAVDKGIEGLVKIDVPSSWANAVDGVTEETANLPEFIKKILIPIDKQEGEKLPVSTFVGIEDGTFPPGTAAYEKRGIAVDVPRWKHENCIQCNQCSYVCPHATIRPFLLTDEEAKNAPEGFITIDAKGKGLDNYKYRMQVTTIDCAGCGTCAQVCPAKDKALVMEPIATQFEQMNNWEYALKLSHKENPLDINTVKGSQFQQPLLEFSGACAGCGETPYAKLMTQLFGDRMYIANATGCSSIWGCSAPSTPYTTNHKGQGPAWANSLFEDAAEFGFGMYLAAKQLRESLELKANALIELGVCKEQAEQWLATLEDAEASKKASAEFEEALKAYNGDAGKDIVKEILENREHLVKKSFWLVGGDGWAYDIGYSGLDHILATGEDVNILVFDTEVYSNTGGQASKSTPLAAVALFSAAGKKAKKKDLGAIAMSYEHVYVAQVAMGANQNQVIKAFAEAEKHKGPSIIIAYSPCINHGLKVGMSNTQLETKNAVDAGYWHLYRYNPALKDEGKNPFIMDSKEPTGSFRDFLMGEVRYSSLQRSFPDKAEALFEKAEKEAKEKYIKYKKLSLG